MSARARVELRPQVVEDPQFPASAGDEVEGMDAPRLPDPIDPPDPLFEPHRIPRELQVDDRTTTFVEVESFAGRVGGQQHAAAAGREAIELHPPFVAGQAPVENRAVAREALTKMKQRVAVLGKDDRLFVQPSEPPEQPLEVPEFRFARRGRSRALQKALQQHAFGPGIAQHR